MVVLRRGRVIETSVVNFLSLVCARLFYIKPIQSLGNFSLTEQYWARAL